MVLQRNSSNHPRQRRAEYALVACFFAFSGLCCSEPANIPSNTPPGVDAATEASADAAADSFPSGSDAADSDASSVDDSSSDTSIDATPDRSVDGTNFDRSIDDGNSDRSIDDGNSDRSIDDGSSDRSIDDASSDQAIDGTVTDAADATTDDAIADQIDTRDSDGPILNATCTVDQPCVNGNCQGLSCDKAWFCFGHVAPHPCPIDVIVPYCGCDGKTYYFPVTCPEVPYEYAGECGDGVNCDPNDVRCAQPEPDCGPGRAASVVAGCYGACVPINSCRCIFSFECPKREIYDCNAEQRCAGPPQQ